MRRRICFTAMALTALAAVGCNGPAKIEIEPKNPRITSRAGTVQLVATVLNKEGTALPGVKRRFKTMTPTMATVDSNGKVTPVTSGTATVLVRAGKLSKEVDILIDIPTKIVILPDSFYLMLGVHKQYKATVYNDRKQVIITGGGVRWTTSDPAVFSVDKFGNIKTLTEGEAVLTAFAAGIKGSAKITVKHEELHKDGALTNER